MPWVYMLKCADGSFYVGSARDLQYRLGQHHDGRGDSYVAQRRPFELVWAQEYDRIDEACEAELKIKRWRRAKKIALIEGRFADLPGLSTPGSHRLTDPDA